MSESQAGTDVEELAIRSTEGHTLRHVGAELDAIKADVLRLGRGAQKQLSCAIDAIVEQSADLAQEVIDGDAELDQLKKQIDTEALRTIALYHPLADDLRRTITAIKVAPMLERIGDIAVNIARRCLTSDDKPGEESSMWGRIGGMTRILMTRDIGAVEAELVDSQSRSIAHIGGLARGMIEDVLTSYEADAVETAVAVWRRGDEIDECYNVLFREIVDFQAREPRLAKACVELIFTAKNLERVGDYVEQIAEVVYFEKTGEDLSKVLPLS